MTNPSNRRRAVAGHSLTKILLLAIFLLSATLLPGARPAHAAGTKSLQFGAPVDDYGNILLTDQIADQLAASGARYARVNFRNPWGTDTAQFYQTYDTIVNRLRARGIEPIGLLSNEFLSGSQAQWQENSYERFGGDGHNTYIDTFGYQAARVAQHFEGRVYYWEIWNEPNCYATSSPWDGYTGCSYIYPSNFAALLAHVWTQVRYYNQFNVQIISGGLFGHEIGGMNQTSAGATYLRETYNVGINVGSWNWILGNAGQYPLDHIGQHIYISQGSTVSSSSLQTYLGWVRSAYTAYEGSNTWKRTFITEIGWRTDAVSESTQAANLRTTFNVSQNTWYVALTCWFFLRDQYGWSEKWGLLRADGSAKPAWNDFRVR
ncbi:MAG TPA: hypothetical protein VFZ66_00035 [Herpetosiphonaceae bacterium]